MSAQIWIYTGGGFLVGIYLLWVVVAEIRLWNYAKAILHLEGQLRFAMEQVGVTQKQVFDIDNRTAHLATRAPRKKAKRKKGKR